MPARPVTLEGLSEQISGFQIENRKAQQAHGLALDRLRQTQDLTVREVRSLALRVAAHDGDIAELKHRISEVEGPGGPIAGAPRGSLPPLSSLGEETPTGTWRIPKVNALKYERMRQDADAWRSVRRAAWKIAIYVASAFALALATLGALALRDVAARHPGGAQVGGE